MKKKERERKRIEENNSEVYKLRDKFWSKLDVICLPDIINLILKQYNLIIYLLFYYQIDLFFHLLFLLLLNINHNNYKIKGRNYNRYLDGGLVLQWVIIQKKLILE